MGWFSRGKAPAVERGRTTVRRAQTIDSWERDVVGRLTGYIPVRGDLDLYDVMRSLSPIIDVAIIKLVRLIGDFRLDGMGNPKLQEALNNIKRSINVGWFSTGFDAFLSQMADSTLAKGFAVGEMVPDALLSGVDRLKVARANDFRFMDKDGKLIMGQMDKNGFQAVELAKPSMIYYMAFDLRDGHPQGVSMMNCLPSVVRTMLRIQQAIDSTTWRIGDPTFLILETAGTNQTDKDLKAALGNHLDGLQEAMLTRKAGGLMDLAFGAAPEGKIEVNVLGADAQLPNMEVPTKITMEQIVARFLLPPFMYGLSWSTTERMAKEQSDMLTSQIWSWRSVIDPIIERIFSTALILQGFNGAKWQHEWNPVNLQDDQKTAVARKMNADAQKSEIDARLQLLDAALITTDSFVGYLIDEGIETEESIKSAGGIDTVAKNYLDAKGTRIAVMLTRSM